MDSSLIIGILGIIIAIIFGLRSKQIIDAFARYVELEKEVTHLKKDESKFKEKISQLEQLKLDIYRHKYIPKTKVFTPGDKVKLISVPKSRGWISDHSKVGMTGIVVDYGPGVYEYTVYWSEADYEGEPIDIYNNQWQTFYVNRDQIERIG